VLGAQDPSVGLEVDLGVVGQPQRRPSLRDLTRVDPSYLEPGRTHGLGAGPRGAADVEAAGHPQELLAGARLELPPGVARVARHLDVERLGVVEAEDPRRAAGGAAAVPDREALEQQGRRAAVGESPRGRSAHGAGPHDDRVVALGHRGPSLPAELGYDRGMRPEATGKRGVPSAKRAKPERPRDRLGRPLAWDAPNELELEDFDALPLERNHELGRRYVREGRYFPAHEAWETAWKQARGSDEAEFFKGLSQMGAGYVHLQRGNRHGAITLLRRAARRIPIRTAGCGPRRWPGAWRPTPGRWRRVGSSSGNTRRWNPPTCSLGPTSGVTWPVGPDRGRGPG
jgi:hypothetical protein